jgi:hypothetical protein
MVLIHWDTGSPLHPALHVSTKRPMLCNLLTYRYNRQRIEMPDNLGFMKPWKNVLIKRGIYEERLN